MSEAIATVAICALLAFGINGCDKHCNYELCLKNSGKDCNEVLK